MSVVYVLCSDSTTSNTRTVPTRYHHATSRVNESRLLRVLSSRRPPLSRRGDQRRSGSGRGPGRVRRWARGRRLTSDKATRRLVVCSRYRYRSLLVGPAPGLAPGSSCWHGRASASPSRCRGVVGFVCVTFTCSANIDNPNPPESPTPAALRRGLSTLPRQSV